MRTRQIAVVAMLITTMVLSGCRIESDKKNGNDNVKIATPFGGMTVKTNDAAVGVRVKIQNVERSGRTAMGAVVLISSSAIV